MKKETIAIHGGFDSDPATKAVAVPIYQTAAYTFDSAEHGAALFNLEVEGFRYTRISNPTTAVLEDRVAQLEGGVGALSVSSGQTALYYATVNVAEMGRNIVSVPQLYGTTYTLFGHILPRQGVQVRFAKIGPCRRHRGADRRQHPRRVLRDGRQSGRQRLRPGGARGSRASSRGTADRRQHGGDADAGPSGRSRRGRGDSFAHQIHGRPWHDARRRGGRLRHLPLARACRLVPHVHAAGRVLSRARLHRPLWRRRFHRPMPERLSAHLGRGALADECVPAPAGNRDRGAADRPARRERAPGGRVPARRPAGRERELRRISGQPLSWPGSKIPRRAGLFAA